MRGKMAGGRSGGNDRPLPYPEIAAGDDRKRQLKSLGRKETMKGWRDKAYDYQQFQSESEAGCAVEE